MDIKRFFIKVEGIVQGVGFRPFVYNLAKKYNLKGWVNNSSEGVFIDIEGLPENINLFINKLKNTPPPLSKIENITIKELNISNFNEFIIKKSEEKKDKITLISPDIATCEDCLNDIRNSKNRRFKYPFTNCTNCGPRFSIIKSIPYDRDKTTMAKFKMCDKCEKEYFSPTNRRFHAQPNACNNCGPHVWITNNKGKKIDTDDAIEWSQKKLIEGKIFAIKGLCGFHIVCDAKNDYAVKLLRQRKVRPDKPFAVMMKDLKTVKKYCHVNKIEEKLLTGIRKPIVLLEKKNNISPHKNISAATAPRQKTLGVMLPYTPLHEILFWNENIEVLIMTSANISGFPLEYDNDTAITNIGNIVDYFLLHNRDIYIPVDDSIARVVNNKVRLIRRARGYVPYPFNFKGIKPILACGPNMKNTFSIGKDNFIFVSQYNGDLENIETFNHYKRNIEHFKDIFSFNPQYIAHDMHPSYMSTNYAESFNLPKISVQHHHAHIVSCMVDNNLDNRNVIGISFDGTGYGTDGKIWGGEFLICNFNEFKRIGHLAYMPLPGGDNAIKEPWRIGASYLYSTLKNIYSKDTALSETISIFGEKCRPIIKMVEKSFNCIETSSMGRLFDAISSIIGVREKISYEGQASIELEALINNTCNMYYNYEIIKEQESYLINPQNIIYSIFKDIKNNVSIDVISSKFHNTIVNFTVDMCVLIRNRININEVVLSGGVFQNAYILSNLIEVLKEKDFTVYSHENIPTNDGGVSIGQIVIANISIPQR
ncbi:carbamoyltransferase HypF [Clostridium tepidiprofundi DSM 19306]|uniref:Carbamoyltransferase n=1 Tax=Clostridium tepidiprofundi DSM 19306 TaxID=1121338 RepID=A0A151B512_9CLOT|nr:carbamoyltransferase HypF [Clostridium tepidiprofundi]KYH34998.1 carbamoyltransferase HypF [Clostridium tepidiprofundi DSM 19306]